MKYTTTTTTLAYLAVISLSHAQSLADLPSCATACLDDAVSKVTSCSTKDLPCICKKFEAIQGVAASCVLGACGNDVALNKVLPVTQQLCAKTGPGSSSSGGNPKPATSGSVLPQPVTPSGSPGTTMTSVATTSAATVSSTSSSSTVSTGSSPTSTAGAAVVGPMGGLAMLVAGGIALL
ncbi:hypothetical protein E4U55_001292 [Claviceps digitariae]|nr:hypothetical protein E4U55_001292 [Claviceps digitariae]